MHYPNLDIHQQRISIDGKCYHAQDFRFSTPTPPFNTEAHRAVYSFLHHWFTKDTTITAYTSGSTGKPKRIIINKVSMMNSAVASCKTLKLRPKINALLCMNTKHIGAQMMIVRALIMNMNLIVVSPTGNPLEGVQKQIHFAAFVPLQVANILSSPHQKAALANIETVIIGGSAIPKNIESQLQHFSNHIYSTYGMTETLSHIALRLLSGKNRSSYYTPLEGVKAYLSAQKTLQIEAPWINEKLTTNDFAEIINNEHFRIIGRMDNVVNSGAIKIHLEEVEQLLEAYLTNSSFALTSLPHPSLGEELVLVYTSYDSPPNLSKYKDILPPFHAPRRAIFIPTIPLTENGKIDRKALQKTVQKVASSTQLT